MPYSSACSALTRSFLSSSFCCCCLKRRYPEAVMAARRRISILWEATLSTTLPIIDLLFTTEPQFNQLTSILYFSKTQNQITTMQSSNIFEYGFRVSANTHNFSVTQALCRANLFTSSADVNYLIRCMADHLPKLGEVGPSFLNWLNVFLFNVCAFNQQLMAEYDNQLLESTESGPQSHRKSKEISQYNQVMAVRAKLKKWLQSVLALPLLQSLFTEIVADVIGREKQVKQLFETIEYLINKYGLSCKNAQKIREVLQQSVESSHFSQIMPLFAVLNKKIFCSGQKFERLMQQVGENYQIEMRDIAKLVTINFVEVNPPRAIFNTAQITGMNFLEENIDFIIRKVAKTDLFSEKIENYRPFELFTHILFQKWAAALLEWNTMVLELTDSNEKGFYLHKKEPVLQKLITFITVYIPNDYPSLHYTLKYTYSSLLAKYSSTDSLQLFKKFLLNRFLLNPSFFALLFSPNQLQMKNYVSNANSLRTLFYQKKVAAIAEQEGNSKIKELHLKAIDGLKGMLSAKERKRSGLEARDRGVYVNDKIVGKLVGELSDVFEGGKLQSNHKSNQSYRSDSSLSFSLKNDSRSRAGQQSPQKHNNSSLPQLPKPTVRTNLSPKHDTTINNVSQFPQQPQSSYYLANASSLARDPVPTTEMGLLDELIALRRQYGEMRRDVDARCSERRGRRERRDRELGMLQTNASELRQQLLLGVNQLTIGTLMF